jgi:hypothetical protein
MSRGPGLLVSLVSVLTFATCGNNDPGRPADGGQGGSAGIDGRDAPAVDLVTGGDAGDAGGAGGDGAGDLAADAPAAPSLLPLRAGNVWHYLVREPGLPASEKTQTVEAAEPVGGRGPSAAEVAFRLVTVKPGGAFGLPDRTVSWQRAEGTKVVRFRELAYRAGTDTVNTEEYWTPYKLRVDGQPLAAPLAVGQRWEERYVEYKVAQSTGAVTALNQVDVWTVSGADLTVTVMAGTFSGCVQLTKTDGTGSDTGKTYVFCPGVGKVRELGRAGVSQSEELTSFTLVP